MSRTFIKFVASLFLIAGFAAASFAQGEENITRPITKSGSMALMFDIGGFGTFGLGGMFIGQSDMDDIDTKIYGVGAKYYISDNNAIRLLLAFSSHSGGEPSGQTVTSSSTLGIAAQYEYHVGPLYSTSPYFGGGISYASTSASSTPSSGTKATTSYSQFGVTAVAGFDWYFTRGLALGAEYHLGYFGNSESNTPSKGDTASPSNIGLGGGAEVHLVVHI
jgi:opacity protein-like surface antigen